MSSARAPPPLPPRQRQGGDISHESLGGPISLPSAVSSLSSATPSRLIAAESRLAFTPSYVAVGAYRLVADPVLRTAVWKKTKHGTIRGALVGAAWLFVAWKPMLGFVERFMMNSSRVTRLAGNHSIFGYSIPLAHYATLVIASAQCWYILKFFLSKNLRIAKARAWEMTIESRGKPESFWGAYVEEWESPPVDKALRARKRAVWERVVFGWAGKFVLHKFVLGPLQLVPIFGIIVSALVKSLGTAKYLHKPYFAAKKMTPDQVELFVQERKLDYYAYGFASSLLESLPFIGLFFSVSNEIGSAMFAHDLEKRQGAFRNGELQKRPKTEVVLVPGIGEKGRVDIRSEMAGDLLLSKKESMPGALAA